MGAQFLYVATPRQKASRFFSQPFLVDADLFY
jgi:hypothetical protein